MLCRQLCFVCCLLALPVTACGKALAGTHYELRMNLTEFTSDSLKLAFDFTSPGDSNNTVSILSFRHDGRVGHAEHEGGPISGGLVDGTSPQDQARIGDGFFFNEIELPLDSVGIAVSAALEITEVAPNAGGAPDELAFFVLNRNETFAFTTVDPDGANSLFTVDVTGMPGGDLTVFAPMEFVAPDTLRLRNSTTDVSIDQRSHGRLRLLDAGPNPFGATLRLRYAIPAPGGPLRIRIYDVAGRLVREAVREYRDAGVWSTTWDGRNRQGQIVSDGIYLIELCIPGQAVVRKIAHAR